MDGFDLRGGESDRWGKASQRQDFSALGGELPVASQVDVVGVGNQVKFAEQVFGRERFPFSIAESRQADDGGFQIVKALAVVEGVYAEDAVGSFRFEGG